MCDAFSRLQQHPKRLLARRQTCSLGSLQAHVSHGGLASWIDVLLAPLSHWQHGSSLKFLLEVGTCSTAMLSQLRCCLHNHFDLYAGTRVPQDGVSMTATCLAAALMVFTLYLLRSIAHGVHAWLTSCRGGINQCNCYCLLPYTKTVAMLPHFCLLNMCTFQHPAQQPFHATQGFLVASSD